jgi:hypothetical protein
VIWQAITGLASGVPLEELLKRADQLYHACPQQSETFSQERNAPEVVKTGQLLTRSTTFSNTHTCSHKKKAISKAFLPKKYLV